MAAHIYDLRMKVERTLAELERENRKLREENERLKHKEVEPSHD